jgi:hypothetical protein
MKTIAPNCRVSLWTYNPRYRVGWRDAQGYSEDRSIVIRHISERKALSKARKVLASNLPSGGNQKGSIVFYAMERKIIIVDNDTGSKRYFGVDERATDPLGDAMRRVERALTGEADDASSSRGPGAPCTSPASTGSESETDTDSTQEAPQDEVDDASVPPSTGANADVTVGT